MKYSLLYHDEKIKKIRKNKFSDKLFIYYKIKNKGNQLFQKKKYRESIDYYIYAYSILKWIEFKDCKKNDEFLTMPSLDPILDSELKECKASLDDVAVELDLFNDCIVYLLINLCSAYMELRHYSEVIQCIDECLSIARDREPDLYLIRSQARSYNKLSNDDDLNQAVLDIKKAISLRKDKIYLEHYDKLQFIIEEKKKIRRKRIESKYKFIQNYLKRAKVFFKILNLRDLSSKNVYIAIIMIISENLRF